MPAKTDTCDTKILDTKTGGRPREFRERRRYAVYFDADEAGAVAVAAQRSGLTVSAWIRRAAVEELRFRRIVLSGPPDDWPPAGPPPDDLDDDPPPPAGPLGRLRSR